MQSTRTTIDNDKYDRHFNNRPGPDPTIGVPSFAKEMSEWVEKVGHEYGPDETERLLAMGHALNWLAKEVDVVIRNEIKSSRTRVVQRLRDMGWSWGKIAGEFGICRSRAVQLADNRKGIRE